MKCSKCGKEISGDYEFCMACGEKIQKVSEPVKTSKKTLLFKKKKVIIISIIVAIILIVSTITLSFVKYNSQRNEIYKNFPWGITREEVKQRIEKNSKIGVLDKENSSGMKYELKKFWGMDIEEGVIIFWFGQNDSLKGISIEFDNIKENGKNKQTGEFLNKRLSKLYGKCVSDFTWETKNGTIIYFPMEEDEYVGGHVIMYEAPGFSFGDY